MKCVRVVATSKAIIKNSSLQKVPKIAFLTARFPLTKHLKKATLVVIIIIISITNGTR